MKQILSVTQKISSTEIKVTDKTGKSMILAGGNKFNIGDSILVVNGIIVQKVKSNVSEIYEV